MLGCVAAASPRTRLTVARARQRGPTGRGRGDVAARGCEARNAQEPHGGGRSGSVAPGETPGRALAGACAEALPGRPGPSDAPESLGPGGGNRRSQ